LLIILGKFGDLTMPKVDRRITKSQEAIKKALIELMSEKNFDNITIQEISEGQMLTEEPSIFIT
jgi:hypothetical protein